MQRPPAASAFAGAAPVFAALGDETRLRIVAHLCRGGPASISHLTSSVDVSRQAVTKHLLALEDAGLVRSGRAGRERIWELQTRRLTQVRRYLEQISDQWDDTLQRLKAFVETDERG
ncbi:MAG: metalloregulator ArsR/SmtB family transcription factor [Steroidobacter sp.]